MLVHFGAFLRSRYTVCALLLSAKGCFSGYCVVMRMFRWWPCLCVRHDRKIFGGSTCHVFMRWRRRPYKLVWQAFDPPSNINLGAGFRGAGSCSADGIAARAGLRPVWTIHGASPRTIFKKGKALQIGHTGQSPARAVARPRRCAWVCDARG